MMFLRKGLMATDDVLNLEEGSGNPFVDKADELGIAHYWLYNEELGASLARDNGVVGGWHGTWQNSPALETPSIAPNVNETCVDLTRAQAEYVSNAAPGAECNFLHAQWDWTVGCVLQPETLNTQWIFTNCQILTSHKGVRWLGLSSGNRMRIDICNGSSYQLIQSADGLRTAGEPHFIVVKAYDDAGTPKLAFYKDGVLHGTPQTITITEGTGDASRSLNLKGFEGVNTYDGKAQLNFIHNAALSDAEIADLSSTIGF